MHLEEYSPMRPGHHPQHPEHHQGGQPRDSGQDDERPGGQGMQTRPCHLLLLQRPDGDISKVQALTDKLCHPCDRGHVQEDPGSQIRAAEISCQTGQKQAE